MGQHQSTPVQETMYKAELLQFSDFDDDGINKQYLSFCKENKYEPDKDGYWNIDYIVKFQQKYPNQNIFEQTIEKDWLEIVPEPISPGMYNTAGTVIYRSGNRVTSEGFNCVITRNV